MTNEAPKEEVKATPTPVPAPPTPVPAPASVVATAKAPEPQMKQIILDIKNPTHISVTTSNTGDISPRVVHDKQLSLSKGMLYKIPITDKSLIFDNYLHLKLKGDVAEKIRVLNVNNGTVLIEPIIHGTIISDEMVVGILF
jgi:hypothetical protein